MTGQVTVQCDAESSGVLPMARREPWRSRILRRIGRVLATAFALVYWVFIIGEGIDGLDAERGALLALLIFTALSVVGGWLSDRVGGAMLVVAGAALAAFVGIAADRNEVIAAVVMGGPFLLAGEALLLAAALRGERRGDEQE